jgi:hypothetical protein
VRVGWSCLVISVSACSPADTLIAPIAPVATVCPSGFRPDGDLCEPVLPSQACPPNARPSLGSTDCVAVGWSTCPQGFRAAASGWGCDSPLPASSCIGATREALGESTCRPLGDCTAAFPPAGASLFVDDDFSGSHLDATHFNSIGAALAAAPGGATIAVFPGRYVDALTPARSVTVVGACAEQVIVDGSSLTDPGLSVPAPITVTLSGVTLSGHAYGLAATGGAQVTVSGVQVTKARMAGVYLSQANTRMELDDSVVRDSLGPTPDASGLGAQVDPGATLVLRRTTLAHNQLVGVNLTGAGASLTLDAAIIRSTVAGSTGELGIAIELASGSNLTMNGSLIADNGDFGVDIRGGSAVISESVVRGTRSRPSGETGVGISVLMGGNLMLPARRSPTTARWG